MAGLCWTALLLTLCLWAQNGEAVLDTQKLAELVNNLVNVYKPSEVLYKTKNKQHTNRPMFSVAVHVPWNIKNQIYDLNQVTTVDPSDQVRDALDKCKVYKGPNVVGATLLKYPDFMHQCPNEPVTWGYVTERCPDVKIWKDFEKCNQIKKLKADKDGLIEHAEYRVLQNFNSLEAKLTGLNKMCNDIKKCSTIKKCFPCIKTDMMLFYVAKSPCYTRCSRVDSNFNILNEIEKIKTWGTYALVFSEIFVPPNPSDTLEKLEQDRRTALQNIGGKIGLENIYRCKIGETNCVSCAAPDGVSNECVVVPTQSTVNSRPPSPK